MQKRNKVSIIGEDILTDRNLTPSEKMVYARICYFEEFFENVETTASYLGLKVWTVQSAKRKLESLGYISCVQNTGRGKVYVADVNLGIYERRRVCLEQSQSLVTTKSDVGKNKVRVCLEQSQSLEKPKSCIGEEIGVLGKNIGKNIGKNENIKNKKSRIFKKPSVEEVQEYCEERNNQVNAESFVDYYESKGWLIGKSPMKDWKAAVRTWERNGYGQQSVGVQVSTKDVLYQPKNQEDVTYQKMFQMWRKYLGVSLKETENQVQSCRELLDDLGEDGLERLIVALRMRSEHSFLTRELTSVKDFVTLNENKMVVQGFYDKNWKMWKMKQEAAAQGKKVWEL